MWKRSLLILLLVFSVTAVAAQEDQTQGNWVPRPDPTLRTTENLQREIAGLRELILSRLQEMDKALNLLQSRADREPTPSVLKIELAGLKELTIEKFASVDAKFQGVTELFKANAGQVDMALVAAKELVLQQNTSFAESNRKAEVDTKARLDQLTALFQTETRALAQRMDSISKSLDDKIVAVTSRVQTIDGTGVGQVAQRNIQESSNTLILGIIAALVGIASLGIAVTVALRRPVSRI